VQLGDILWAAVVARDLLAFVGNDVGGAKPLLLPWPLAVIALLRSGQEPGTGTAPHHCAVGALGQSQRLVRVAHVAAAAIHHTGGDIDDTLWARQCLLPLEVDHPWAVSAHPSKAETAGW